MASPCIPWHSLPPNSCSRGRVIKFANAFIYIDGVFRYGDLWVRDGRVIDPASRFWEAVTFGEHSCDVAVDCEDNILSPGFIDIQFNGESMRPMWLSPHPALCIKARESAFF